MPLTDLDAWVTTDWLAAHHGDSEVAILDGSFKLPGVTPSAAEDYAAQHIPGAIFFDIDHIADPNTRLPHMLPTPGEFARHVGAMGISNSTRVVVYDKPGLMSAARVWWTFRAFGHDNVAVLNGGLKKWLAEGRPATSAILSPPPVDFRAALRPQLVRNKSELLRNLESRAEQVIDARAAARFDAIEKETRPGLRSGHIPYSRNLPFSALTNPDTGELKSPAELRDAFIGSGLDLDRPVVATCGSGVTASALAFGLFLLGRDDVAVYDGAWAEWGLPGDTPVWHGEAD